MAFNDKEFNFEVYYISAFKILEEINIRSEKITPQTIAREYSLLKEKIAEYNRLIQGIEAEINLKALNDRIRIKQELAERFRENKRLIKEKLLELNVEVKPGSELSKLLRLDYLPNPEEKDIPPVIKKRF